MIERKPSSTLPLEYSADEREDDESREPLLLRCLHYLNARESILISLKPISTSLRGLKWIVAGRLKDDDERRSSSN